MKKRWIGMSVAALCVAGVLGVAAGAAPTPDVAGLGLGGEQQGPLARLVSGQFGRLLTLRSEVNLTSDQKVKIKTIVSAHKAEIAAVAKPLVEKRRALRDAVSAKAPDEKVIRAAADELGKSIGNAAVLGSKVKAEVRVVLTPEQAQKIEEFRKQSDQTVDSFIQDMGKP
jgi:Spy/CpxP family protein refolding chaperone